MWDIVLAVGYMALGGVIVMLVEAWRERKAISRPLYAVYPVTQSQWVSASISPRGLMVETWCVDFDGQDFKLGEWNVSALELAELVETGGMQA